MRNARKRRLKRHQRRHPGAPISLQPRVVKPKRNRLPPVDIAANLAGAVKAKVTRRRLSEDDVGEMLTKPKRKPGRPKKEVA